MIEKILRIDCRVYQERIGDYLLMHTESYDVSKVSVVPFPKTWVNTERWTHAEVFSLDKSFKTEKAALAYMKRGSN